MDLKDKHEVDTKCFSTQGVTNSTTHSLVVGDHKFTTLSIKIVICLLVDEWSTTPKRICNIGIAEIPNLTNQ